MGGLAFRAQGVQTDRLDKTAYLTFTSSAVLAIEKHLGEPVKVITSYFDKKDFGDVDILIKSSLRNTMTDGILYQALNATHMVKNGGVVSYRVPTRDGKHFQVDLIYVGDHEIDFAENYFAFNDLGNLIGRVAHAMGFKFGHNGLWYIIRKGTHVLSEVEVTKSFPTALTFLGFEAERFEQGFNTLEDIYQFVADSSFFNSDIFLLKNRNHAARTRDSKRKTYMSFLQWLQDTKTKSFQYPDAKLEWMTRAFDYFPDLDLKLRAVEEQYQKSLRVKEKFNGDIVSDLTGLEGKDLGRFISWLKHSFESTEEFSQYVLDTDNVENWIRINFENWSMAYA